MHVSMHQKQGQLGCEVWRYQDLALTGGMLFMSIDEHRVTIHARTANDIISLGESIARGGRELAGSIECEAMHVEAAVVREAVATDQSGRGVVNPGGKS